MTANPKRLALALALCSAAWPALAGAQTTSDDQAMAAAQIGSGEQDPEGQMALGRGELREQLQSRFDAAVGLSRDPAVVNADNSRFIWAWEAKAQCGIALGYLKSGYRDPISIGKCANAAAWMNRQPAAMPMPTPTSTVTPEICRQQIAGTVFFDWDSSVPPPDAGQIVAYIANTMQACGRTALDVRGHADRSGSDAYNDPLSLRRAEAVAGMLTAAGVAGSALTVGGSGEREPRVPTPDGVRNPQNRRVEITAK